ncbi:MAG: hypothetical protein DHS20C15_18840 [Planctomycetota bacterium]|nr:MAG: hypothetical protein DHS20C15_18840 [Planctomycetota bacterium]
MTAEGSPTDTLPTRRFVFGALCKVGVGILVGLVIADFAAGAYDTDRDLRRPGALEVDEHLAWTNKPGATLNDGKTHINSHGLRGPEIPADADPRELRLLGMGASRTFGDGTDEDDQIWSNVLQTLLSREHPGTRVLNGGVNGYSAMQSARRAMKLNPVLQPDLILLVISPGAQMLLDPSSAANWTTVDGEIAPRDVVEAFPAVFASLAVRAHKLLLGSNLYARYRAQLASSGDRPPELRRFIYSERPRSAEAESMMQPVWNELREFAAFAAQHEVEVRAVLIPEAHQGSDEIWNKWKLSSTQRGGPALDMPREEPTLALRARLEGIGFKVWVLDEAILQIGSNVDRFTVDERHWSALGHRIIGTELMRAFEQEPELLDTLAARRQANPRG